MSEYDDAARRTVLSLKTMLDSEQIRQISELSLPEIESIMEQVGRIVPAGNVPNIILNGLLRLTGRKPALNNVRRDINSLLLGVEQTLDAVVYSTFFAGPASVIWAYQNMLRLVGRRPDDAFPEGTWQFYVDYALREDTARHTHETHGFDTRLRQHNVILEQVDRVTAWVMAAITCLHQYHDLLANEWRERVSLHLLREITGDRKDAAHYAQLYRAWEKQRPYGRGSDSVAHETYAEYRQRKFDDFLKINTKSLSRRQRRTWQDQLNQAVQTDLPAYQRQMSILAYLDPETYGENRVPINLQDACIGVIHQGYYHLIPVCASDRRAPTSVQLVRQQVLRIFATRPDFASDSLVPFATVKRRALAGLRGRLDADLRESLDALRQAPILFNANRLPRNLTLSEMRQAERGIGDHAMTVFDTGSSFVFDQSHIFFDGAWGAALAEILTNEALAWATYLHTLPPVTADGAVRVYTPCFELKSNTLKQLDRAPQIAPEVSAETTQVNLAAIMTLRRLLRSRSAHIRLTVNDLLVLYRAIHAVTYRPSPQLEEAFRALSRARGARQKAIQAAYQAIIHAGEINASILIPIDASQQSPRDRLFPMTFEVPLQELNLLGLHRKTLKLWQAHRKGDGDRTALFEQLEEYQRRYLATLAGFGSVMERAKAIAISGQSSSVNTIKLLAHMPTAMQRLLDRIPDRIEMLNDLIRGREVFSNVGAVVPGSSLVRFSSAKDDNDKKTLVWAALTDAEGIMHISLRDFRPHVGQLIAVGQRDLAVQIAEDYLNAYAHGLNRYVAELQRIALAGRETQNS